MDGVVISTRIFFFFFFFFRLTATSHTHNETTFHGSHKCAPFITLCSLVG